MTDDEDRPLFEVVAPTFEGAPEAPPPPRRTRRRWPWDRWALGISIVLAVAVLATALLIFRPPPTSDGQALPVPPGSVRTSASSTPPSSPTGSSAVPTTGSADPTGSSEPTATPKDSCGEEIDLPTFLGTTPRKDSGITVLLGAGTRVDLDTGQSTQPQMGITAEERILQTVRLGKYSYITVGPCGPANEDPRILRVDDHGQVTKVPFPFSDTPSFRQLTVFQDRLYASRIGGPDGRTTLVPFDGSATVTMSKNFFVIGISGKHLIGQRSDGGRTETIAYSPQDRTATDIGNLGDGSSPYVLAVGDGFVIWTEHQKDGSGLLHRFDLATLQDESLGMSVPQAFSSTAISPDGRYLLGQLTGEASLSGTFTQLPCTYAVFDLGLDKLTEIPDLAVADLFRTSVGLAFSRSGHEVIITAEAADGLHLLLWRPGERTITESPRVLPRPIAGTYPLAIDPKS